MVVHASKAEVLIWQMAEPLHGACDAHLARLHLREKLG
jgi:hypothetical protein